jgi:hypothetical protein
MKYIAIAMLMLVICIGCGSPSKTSTQSSANWDGLWTDASASTTMNIWGNNPHYAVSVGEPCGETSVNFSVDSWDPSVTSNVTLATTTCSNGTVFSYPQQWELNGNTLFITYFNGTPTARYTR